MLLTAVANALSLSPIVKASQDVEAIERVVAQKRYICLLNHGHIPAVVTLPSAGDGASLELPPLGMRIEQSAL